jgi:hypothetical protein
MASKNSGNSSKTQSQPAQPDSVAAKTGAGTTVGQTGSADAVVESERSKAATRTESGSPYRKSSVKKPAASGGDAQTAKQKTKRDALKELDDLKAELAQALGHPFGQIRPEEPPVQEPIT